MLDRLIVGFIGFCVLFTLVFFSPALGALFDVSDKTTMPLVGLASLVLLVVLVIKKLTR